MSDKPVFELAPVFQAVQDVMEAYRLDFNRADQVNQNHGDHMLEIFQIAVQAAREKQEAGMAEAMGAAASMLNERVENGSARVYASGLAQFAQQFIKFEISLGDLVFYAQGLIKDKEETQAEGALRAHTPVEDADAQAAKVSHSGDVLKALVFGLAGWKAAESEKAGSAQVKPGGMDLGTMFDLGITYMQAKSRGGSRLEVLADAAAAASPLSRVSYRYQSGKRAILALLQALVDTI